VRFPSCEDVAGEEHLSDDQPVIGEGTGVAFDEAALADGGGRLESGEVAGSSFNPEGGETGGDGSGADEDGRMTGLP